MILEWSEFEQLRFPTHGDIVYVLCYAAQEGDSPVPFYVGESSRHIGRLGDYLSAKFTAPTDFKVGEAIRHFHDLGYSVTFMHKKSSSRKADEKSLLKKLKDSGFLLLNDLRGYKCSSADAKNERGKIRRFVERMTREPRIEKR